METHSSVSSIKHLRISHIFLHAFKQNNQKEQNRLPETIENFLEYAAGRNHFSSASEQLNLTESDF